MIKLYELFVEGKRYVGDFVTYLRPLDGDEDFIKFARRRNIPVSKTYKKEIALKDLSEGERNSLTTFELSHLGGKLKWIKNLKKH